MSTLQTSIGEEAVRASLARSSRFSATPRPDELIGLNPREVVTDWGGRGIVVGDPKHPDPDNSGFVAPHAVICSVFNGVLKTPPLAFRCAGSPQFVIPKPPEDGFSCLRVYDTYALISDIGKLSDPNYEQRADQTTMARIPALSPSGHGGLAYDIIQQIAGDMHGATTGRMLGIGLIQGELPTQGEWKSLRERQEELYRFYVHEGDRLALAQEMDQIRDFHRFALSELGDFDPVRHPWFKDIMKQTMKNCFLCHKIIFQLATRCEYCHGDLVAEAVKRWELTGRKPGGVEGDEVVEREVDAAIKKSLAERVKSK